MNLSCTYIYITRTVENNNPGETVLRNKIAYWRQYALSAWKDWREDDYHWYQQCILEAEQMLSQCTPGPNPGEYTIKLTTAEIGDRGYYKSRAKPYSLQYRERQVAQDRADKLVSRASNFMTTCLVHLEELEKRKAKKTEKFIEVGLAAAYRYTTPQFPYRSMSP